jgi:hypothetical protein
MKTRTLAALVTLAAAACGSPVYAQNADATIGVLMTRLNGTPTKVGTLESAGTSISNAATTTPFTVTVGTTYMVQCNGTAHVVLSGATASLTITAATYGLRLQATDLPFPWIARSTSISMIPASGSVSCAVWSLA